MNLKNWFKIKKSKTKKKILVVGTGIENLVMNNRWGFAIPFGYRSWSLPCSDAFWRPAVCRGLLGLFLETCRGLLGCLCPSALLWSDRAWDCLVWKPDARLIGLEKHYITRQGVGRRVRPIVDRWHCLDGTGVDDFPWSEVSFDEQSVHWYWNCLSTLKLCLLHEGLIWCTVGKSMVGSLTLPPLTQWTVGHVLLSCWI